MTTSRPRQLKTPPRERDVPIGRHYRNSWNILLFLAVMLFWAGLWCTLVFTLSWLHLHFYPSQYLPTSRGDGRILAVVAAFVASLLPAMIAANGLVWLIPRARTALEKEAESISGGSFSTAQRGLFNLARLLVPTALLVGALASMLSW